MRKQVPQHVWLPAAAKPMAVSHLDGYRFHIFRRGSPTAVIECVTHVVVRTDLANLISSLCPNQISVFPAEVKQVAFGEGSTNYCVLHLGSELTPENIGTVANDGNRVWPYHCQHLFVSSAVAEVLRQKFPSELEFFHGFSMFAGYA